MDAQSGLKVMLVDDDTFLLEMYALKFKKNNFEVETVTSAADCISKIKGGAKPDIILMDIIMPQTDGLELLKIVNTENLLPKATKIMLTNQGQQSDVDKANEIGCDGYIIKALFTPSEVVEQVKKIHAAKK